MEKNIEKIPYRQGVRGYLFNDRNQMLLVTGESDTSFWKVPSGGMESGEKPEQTLVREMKEELNVIVEPIKLCNFKIKFEWSLNLIKEHNYKFRGQEHFVFIARIKKGQTIKPDPKEVSGFKWVDFEKLNDFFKFDDQKELASKVIQEIKKLKVKN